LKSWVNKNPRLLEAAFRRTRLLLPALGLLLTSCGTASLDLAGYPDKARDRLYADGRVGGDKGLTDFDLRTAWRMVSDP
jgi:hypothetical protein